MPRPEMTEEYFADLEMKAKFFHEDPPEDIVARLSEIPYFRQKYNEIFMSGIWLGDELKKLGASETQIEQICFAYGQRCFGSSDVWETAKEQVQKFREGQADIPGLKLAEEILKDFPRNS